MNIDEKLGCVRPLIYEYEDQEDPENVERYPYWMKGTCFLVGHLDYTFVVTARHVLQNQALAGLDATFLSDDVRVFVADGSRDFIPLNRCIQMKGDDKRYKDLLLYRVASDTMDPTLRFKMVASQYEITSLAVNPARLLTPNVELVTRGHPARSNVIDHEKERVRLTPTSLKGRLSGCNGRERICRLSWDKRDIHRIEKESREYCQFDPNGMSGSPVLHLQSGQLVGVLVMGNRSIGHFISASILYTVIGNFLSEKAD
ncbi:MAG: trypsin-like peptidase domain-containing protein [Gemmatimonadota bacterium]|nr:trypsin-like peptidase domain-containing protein [Gemmatimonadota bacterium]